MLRPANHKSSLIVARIPGVVGRAASITAIASISFLQRNSKFETNLVSITEFGF